MTALRSLILVEPCQDLAAILRSKVLPLGFYVAVAADAVEAKEAVQQFTFDVAVVDHDLVAPTSLSLCSWLSSQTGPERLRGVILLSNHVDLLLHLRASACGVSACISKQTWRHDLPAELERVSKSFDGQNFSDESSHDSGDRFLHIRQ